MFERLEKIEERYHELGQQIASPDLVSDVEQLQKLAQERAGIEDLVAKYREYKANARTLEETRAMLDDGLDEEMATLVKQEIENLEQKLKILLLPSDG